jgi:hypothetical protein
LGYGAVVINNSDRGGRVISEIKLESSPYNWDSLDTAS